MLFLGLVLGAVCVTPCVLVYMLFIRGADRYEPEPLWLLAAMLCWGAFGATGVSVVGSTIGQGAIGLAMGAGGDDAVVAASTATFVAPLVEESAKALGLVMLWILSSLWLKELDGPLDGAIYGGMVGLGFTLTEDVLYLGWALADGGLGAFGFVFVLRTILSGLGHASFTAVAGLGFGIAAESRHATVKVIAPLLGWAGAVGLHLMHNLLLTFLLGGGVGVLVKFVLFWLFDLLFFVLVVILVVRDRAIVQSGLVDELGVLIDERELELTASWWMLVPLWNLFALSPSPAGYTLSRRKQLALIELAFLKQRRRRGESGLDEMEEHLRGEILDANRAGVWLGARVR